MMAHFFKFTESVLFVTLQIQPIDKHNLFRRYHSIPKKILNCARALGESIF